METKQFKFGGLEITLYKHSQYGWVTDPQSFANVIGTTKRHLNRTMRKFGLISQNLAAEDKDFGTEISRINNATNLSRCGNDNGTQMSRCRKSAVVISIKGMIFITQVINTQVSQAFRKEVLETIEWVEGKGYCDLKALSEAILDLQRSDGLKTAMIIELQNTTNENKILISKLVDKVFDQQATINNQQATINNQQAIINNIKTAAVHNKKARELDSSAAGKSLAATKARKKAETLLN
jgi:hypothetical protein